MSGHGRDRRGGGGEGDGAGGREPGAAAGKRTLTMALPARSPAQRAASRASPTAEAAADRGLPADGAGAPMAGDVRARMEDAFGTDFSSVRIHEGAQSDALGAQAFTQGTDIHFAPGQYQPGSDGGRALLGHELTHVVQQAQGRVSATTQAKGVGINDDDGLEREADELGAKAARGERIDGTAGVESRGAGPGDGAVGPAAQRKPLDRLVAAAAGPVQLKGWIWRKAGSTWEEVDAAEPNTRGTPRLHGDGDGEVYDDQTQGWHRNVDDYRRHTARLANPAFVAGSAQRDEDLAGMAGRDVGRGIGPMPGAAAKLGSFLGRGVLTPADAGGDVTTSADEKSRPDQISVNKFGPFPGHDDPARTAEYATLNAANGAIPIVLENGVDRIGPDDEPDVGALAARAHNSALAIIDPSGLGQAAQGTIRLAGTGELTLTSSIPASNFVTVLVPIQLRPLIPLAEVARCKIRFIGSREARVRFNYKTTAMQSESTELVTAIPDYQSALTEIFSANRGSTLLTHVIRLSPKVPIPTRPTGGAAEAEAEAEAGSASALGSSMERLDVGGRSPPPPGREAAASASSSSSAAGPALPPPAPAAAMDEGTLSRLASAVIEQYPGVYDLETAAITSADDLRQKHANLGVTDANKDAIYALLEGSGIWLC